MWIQRFLPYRRPVIVLAHAVLVAAAYLLAILLRFDFDIPPYFWERFSLTFPLLVLIRLVTFAWYRLYEGLWRYVSMYDILKILKAVTVGSLIFVVGVLLLFGHNFPRSVLILEWVLSLALVGGVRLVTRALRESSWKQLPTLVGRKRVLIVGAGDAGEMLLRELDRSLTLNYEVVGFVDDDPQKHGRRIHGIEVLGTSTALPELCRANGVQEILIAIPSATREQRRRILERCRTSGVPFKTIPSLPELLQGKARIGQLQDVSPEDLLGREPVRLEVDRLRAELHGKRILVTGAGGSIGAELCRQLAIFEPELLVLFERAESSLYFVDVELRSRHPKLAVEPVVGDILDPRRVGEAMFRYRPDIVYHAAAYKHVPLMEAHPLEAIANNVFGTETVALAARQGAVKKFVFISTDKAVRPVGIMGMTKRVAECLLLSLNGGPTTYVAVRFGNVLGSDGSVLPLFRWQIAQGGPVTVTDPEATRYFMLLSEAAQLVLQAGAMGKGGEVFFLDMGEPVRILDLAENLIRLSGLEPGRDVPIEVTGLRPGERLREELVMEGEDLLRTAHERVLMVRNHSFDAEGFSRDLERLRDLVVAREREGAAAHLRAMAARY
ncbi:MAG: capsular polysaccharide biosynthesis protein CapD [Gemmatimonadales bacterium]|nr:MAG: capsular polysaccharide biosynthesis protein CapD [Gemmatimonadales bacterium]